jgi:NADH:ubiquinone reductase (H+-translocating)
MAQGRMMGKPPRVVILGCGFAGLAAAQALAGRAVEVTIVDRANHHVFQPLLYQVATAGLAAPAIAAPIRQILRDARNVTTLLGDVTAIDVEQRQVRLDHGTTLAYDHLIVATGATHSYFGHEQWARFAPGLKTLDDALEIRRRILNAFERAERESDPEQRRAWLTFAIVGAGPTGVELAGTLAEIALRTLRDEFRSFDSGDARVVLIEGSDRVLPSYPADLSEQARRDLESLGVEVRTDCRVSDIDSQGVWLGTQALPARTVLWAAGVAASALGRDLGAQRDRAGRIVVNADLSVPGHPGVHVAGDLASVVSRGQPVPGIAPAAKQMGRRAARNVLRRIAGRPSVPFVYRDYGALATIGRSAAVAAIGRFKFSGASAWWLWLCTHVYFLIGFRNRLVVLIDWAWAYGTFERHARIMLGNRGP